MSEKAYDNTVLGAGGYSDAGEIDLSKELTGENTTSSLIDAILPGIPLVGLGIKGGKSIPWGAILERLGIKGGKAAWSQAAKNKVVSKKLIDKQLANVNKKVDEELRDFPFLGNTPNYKSENMIRKLHTDEALRDVLLSNAPNEALKRAISKGLSGKKAIEKVFARRPDGSYFMKGNLNTDKYTLDMQGNTRKLAKNFPSSVNPKDMPIDATRRPLTGRPLDAHKHQFADWSLANKKVPSDKGMPIGTMGASPRLPKWSNVKSAVAERMPSSNKMRNIAMKVLPFLYGGAAGSTIARTNNPELWKGSLAGDFMDWLPKALRPDPEMPSKEELDSYIELYGDYNKWKKEDEKKPMNMWEYYGNPLKK